MHASSQRTGRSATGATPSFLEVHCAALAPWRAGQREGVCHPCTGRGHSEAGSLPLRRRLNLESNIAHMPRLCESNCNTESSIKETCSSSHDTRFTTSTLRVTRRREHLLLSLALYQCKLTGVLSIASSSLFERGILVYTFISRYSTK
jgi:hypothetical protein